MKELLLGIAIIIIVGFGGLVYRNAVEHPNQPIACPMDAKLCPDGTSVARTGLSCIFPVCPPPNVSLDEVGVAFAIPAGFEPTEVAGGASVVAYELPKSASSSVSTARITLSRYATNASTSPAEMIRETAIGSPSGMPVSVSAISSTEISYQQYTVVKIERFEGVIDTAYYLKRADKGDMLRFDAIDSGVADWMNPSLDLSTLPAHASLVKLLSTLESRGA